MFKKFSCLLKNLSLLSKVDLKKNPAIMLDVDEYIENILYYIPSSDVERPVVCNSIETAKLLLETNKSLARFGDGEVEIIRGNGIPYQKYDKELALRLKEILENKQENLLVGIGLFDSFGEQV